MTARGAWFVTPHAIDRYIARVSPRSSREQALAFLIEQSASARRGKEIEPGVWQYRGPSPLRLRYRVSTRLPGLPQLLTVLPTHDGLEMGR